MKILIDGYNLGLETGTGVATYGRNLAGALKELGHEIGYLTDKRIKPGPAAAFQFYSAQKTGRSYLKGLGFFHLVKDLVFRKRRLRLQELDPRQTALIELKAMNEMFPAFDFFASMIGLFEFAHIYFQLFKRFLPLKLKHNIDIMHWTYPVPIHITGEKNIYTIHDVIPLKYPFYTLENLEFYHLMLKHITQKSDMVVTVSEQSKRDLITFFQVEEHRIINTYQSIDWDFKSSWTGAAEDGYLANSFDLSAGQYFLFVGALEPKKNIERIIDAFLISDIDVPLVLVGPKGWFIHENIATIIKNTKNIHYLEYLPRNTVQLLMKNARAILFPSLYEGFGLPVLEAMKMGTPVVTSDVGSMVEVAGDAAMKVNPYRIKELVAAFRALNAEDSLLQQMTERGKLQCQKFSGEVYKSNLEQLYEKVQAG